MLNCEDCFHQCLRSEVSKDSQIHIRPKIRPFINLYLILLLNLSVNLSTSRLSDTGLKLLIYYY